MSALDTIDPAVVAAFRRRLRANAALVPYRALDGSGSPWEDSAAGSDSALRRFIYARKGDLAKAEAMYAAHLVWRTKVFPIEEEGAVADLLRDGRRFFRIGKCGDGMPLIGIDFCWGYFMDGFAPVDCLRATLMFIEREIEHTDAGGKGLPQACIVSYGGPPPIDFAGALAVTLEANYPERLNKGAIYPVPRMIARLVQAFLWIFDKDTAKKISIVSDEEDFLKFVGLSSAEIPERIRGGLEAAERKFQPDSTTRMNRLLYGGISSGLGPSRKILQQLLVPVPAKSSARRRRPGQDGGGGWWTCCFRREEPSSPRSESPGFGALHSSLDPVDTGVEAAPGVGGVATLLRPSASSAIFFATIAFVLWFLSRAVPSASPFIGANALR